MTPCQCEINFIIDDEIVDFNVANENVNFGLSNGYIVSPDTSYIPLTDKPQINYHTLEAGNNTYEELGVEPTIIDITEQDIDTIIYGG